MLRLDLHPYRRRRELGPRARNLGDPRGLEEVGVEVHRVGEVERANHVRGAVDLIVINGRVYAADVRELAEAVAVRGNTVVRVGSNREIQRLRRAQTTVIDAKGRQLV